VIKFAGHTQLEEGEEGEPKTVLVPRVTIVPTPSRTASEMGRLP
jgi:hypothetical protein